MRYAINKCATVLRAGVGGLDWRVILDYRAGILSLHLAANDATQSLFCQPTPKKTVLPELCIVGGLMIGLNCEAIKCRAGRMTSIHARTPPMDTTRRVWMWISFR